jgi:mRNA-degrading endonuclease RelE of RelBE toxin-antitoxin system
MSYNVLTIPPFEKQLKRLVKKYPSLKKEITLLGVQLSQEPTIGTPLGHHCYKIRLSISSKGKGKSGGGRAIACVQVTKKSVYLLSIYDKSEKVDISNNELSYLLSHII